jgi:hypothetical protein
VLGGIMVVAGGAVIGAVGALVLGLLVTPGAATAVLCPTCYRDPPPEQVWRAGLVYFSVLGAVTGLMPGDRLRAGVALGVVLVALQSAGYWGHFGAGLTILPGVVLVVLGWSIQLALRRLVARQAGPGGSDPGGAPPADYWDGRSWRAARGGPAEHGQR